MFLFQEISIVEYQNSCRYSIILENKKFKLLLKCSACLDTEIEDKSMGFRSLCY